MIAIKEAGGRFTLIRSQLFSEPQLISAYWQMKVTRQKNATLRIRDSTITPRE